MNIRPTDFSGFKHISQRIAEDNYASEFYRQIVESIRDFEQDLNPDEEIGARLVSFGQTVQFHIEDIGYYNPSLIKFIGTLDNGSKVELIQHVSQISFMLMALPKQTEDEPAKRIGFKLMEEE